MLAAGLLQVAHPADAQNVACAPPDSAEAVYFRASDQRVKPCMFDIAARVVRLWDIHGSPIAMVQFAVTLRDDTLAHTQYLSSPTTPRMTFRQMGARPEVRDTTWRQGLDRPENARSGILAEGFVAAPLVPWLTSWTVRANTARWIRTSGSAPIGLQPLPQGPIVVSDLALAGDETPDIWDVGDDQVRLSRSNVFNRKAPIHLSYQVKSDSSHNDIKTWVTLTDVSDHGSGTRLLQLNFPGRLIAGVTFVERDINMSKQKSGTYQLEVQVGSTRGGGASVRVTTFTIR
jgi:hypothetical protein